MFCFFVTAWLGVPHDGDADFIWFLEPTTTSIDLISILEHASEGLINAAQHIGIASLY